MFYKPIVFLSVKKLILILCFLSSCSQADGDKYYLVCDVDDEKKSPESFDGKLNYFDSMVEYEKTGPGEYKASLGGGPGSLGLQIKGNVLSEAYLKFTGERQGFYREMFDVYRFDLETRVLIHSYVYYISKKNFEKNFNIPLFMDQNLPLLFDLVPRKAPKGYVKIGWDKTRWQCYEISYWQNLKYMFFSLAFLFTA